MNNNFMIVSLQNVYAVTMMHFDTVDKLIAARGPVNSDVHDLLDALDEAQAAIQDAIAAAERANDAAPA